MERDNELLSMLRKSREQTAKLEALAGEPETKARDRAAMQAELDRIGPVTDVAVQEGGRYGTLADQLLNAGWDHKSHPVAMADIHAVLETKSGGVESKAGSLDGGSSIQDAVPYRYTAPELGFDTRFIQPSLPTENVPPDATGVSSYVQKSRSLAATNDMIRTIAAVTAKPETNTVAEVVNPALKQIATVSTGTPNVLIANPNFRSWVNNDLTLAFRRAVDAHIVAQVTAASIQNGDGGIGAYESILYAQEAVRAAGYNPTLIVVSPTDALTIQLLEQASGVTYTFPQQLPTMVVSPSVDDDEGFVCDPSALGTFYVSPFTLAAFEEDAGSTNASTVRAEANGLFIVQRPDAAATFFAAES